MPDEQRTVGFLRSLLDAAGTSSSWDVSQAGRGTDDPKGLELILARDSGIWEQAYKNLEKEYPDGSVKVSLCTSPNSPWWISTLR